MRTSLRSQLLRIGQTARNKNCAARSKIEVSADAAANCDCARDTIVDAPVGLNTGYAAAVERMIASASEASGINGEMDRRRFGASTGGDQSRIV
jgi:hypothetical protein